MTTTNHQTVAKPFDWQKWLFYLGLILVCAVGTWGTVRRAPAPLTIPVPAYDLPAYHLIVTSDLLTVSLSPTELAVDAIKSNSDILGHYARERLAAGKAILASQLVPSSDPALNLNTSVLSIPATRAMTFGGRLTSGDIVSVWQVSTRRDAVAGAPQFLLDRILVLDVLPAASDAPNAAQDFPYTVILAVPIDHQVQILAAAARGALLFTLHP